MYGGEVEYFLTEMQVSVELLAIVSHTNDHHPRGSAVAVEVGGVELVALLGIWPIGNTRPPSFLGHCTQCCADNRHG